MPINPKPIRAHRSDWRAFWPGDGETHYIGHSTWIEITPDKTGPIYCDRDPGDWKDTPRAIQAIRRSSKNRQDADSD